MTTDDLDGLARWQEMFGPGFRAILAFAYAEPLAAVRPAERGRGVRVPGPGLPVLGRRARRLRRPPPLAGAGLEGRRHGPGRVPPQSPPPPGMAADDARSPQATPTRQGARPMTTTLTRFFAALALGLTLGLAPSPRRPPPRPPRSRPTASSTSPSTPTPSNSRDRGGSRLDLPLYRRPRPWRPACTTGVSPRHNSASERHVWTRRCLSQCPGEDSPIDARHSSDRRRADQVAADPCARRC